MMIRDSAEIVRTRLRQRHIRVRTLRWGYLRVPLTMPRGLNDYVWRNTALQVSEMLVRMIRNKVKRSEQIRVLPKSPLLISEILLTPRHTIQLVIGTVGTILRRYERNLMPTLRNCTRQIINDWFYASVAGARDRQVSGCNNSYRKCFHNFNLHRQRKIHQSQP